MISDVPVTDTRARAARCGASVSRSDTACGWAACTAGVHPACAGTVGGLLSNRLRSNQSTPRQSARILRRRS
jgi:hypothetical protein